MGLDIYAGTFTRYYSRNWKTATQQYCEENGINYQQIRADEEETASVEEIQESVGNWQRQLAEALHNSGVNSFATWQDDNEKPYYTEKPDWDAFGALLLFTAAKALGKQVPKEYKKGMDYNKTSFVTKARKKKFEHWALYAGVCHFLPCHENLQFIWYLANSMEAPLGTTGGLSEELNLMNKIGWNASEEEILQWYQTEGYPVDAELVDGKYVKQEEHQTYDTESLAKYAYSILYQAVQFSKQERVPVILDI